MAGRARVIVMILLASLLAACAAEPVSQATSVPSSAGPSAASSVEPSGELPSPAASPTAAPPSSAPVVTITVPPPKPGNPTFKLVESTPDPTTGAMTEKYELTWTAPDGAASGFLVYGLTKCLRNAKKYDGKPCVVRGMRIAKDDLVLLTQVPGDARSATVTWQGGEAGPPPYAAILVRATNPYGDSIFTIVHSETVCFGCVY